MGQLGRSPPRDFRTDITGFRRMPRPLSLRCTRSAAWPDRVRLMATDAMLRCGGRGARGAPALADPLPRGGGPWCQTGTEPPGLHRNQRDFCLPGSGIDGRMRVAWQSARDVSWAISFEVQRPHFLGRLRGFYFAVGATQRRMHLHLGVWWCRAVPPWFESVAADPW